MRLKNSRGNVGEVLPHVFEKMNDLGDGLTLRNHPVSLKNNLTRSYLNVLTK